ncbi:hypothetical protein ACIBCD_15535 [Nocardia brasiliensis]|uniref:hypothetical protein n=1 Tax=Nocardia brasiliensis TaxID=37326 RepID=UPI0037BD0931
MTHDTTGPTATPARAGRSISINVSTAVGIVVIASLVVALLVTGGLLMAARGELADRDAAAAAEHRAEQVATDYAVGSATVKFDDLGAWVTRLKNNASPALAAKFDASAPKLQEILTPLQWTSTATPVAATVISHNGGIYKVDVFVDVNATNSQNPAGARSTVTYTVTVDSDADWHITDVGGSDGALPLK